ncbi:acylphosphatase [Actinotalea subterranea]|uniref:acylphosphatase n=1 Tax=Actinotalea subterranea TaxID=2607497 RepID=UPI0011EBD359|nr:acylphosphatase [Actinotalea subterranea]
MAASAGCAARDRSTGPVTSARLVVDGVVQGVGFRPFVWRLANELGLEGQVRNVGGRVEIEATGTPGALAELTRRLRAEAPPRARVDEIRSGPLTTPRSRQARDLGAFVIAGSAPGTQVERLFPPDLATCPACLAELRDPGDRRYRYPFLNCTDCGPRATIIDDLPYDRAATSMRDFPLCPACDREYHDPGDRRFHAEPVACPTCGPHLTYRRSGDAAPGAHGDDALAAAVTALRAGQVVAVSCGSQRVAASTAARRPPR